MSAEQDAKHQVDLDKIAAGVRLILEGIGEDTARPGLLETPQRVANDLHAGFELRLHYFGCTGSSQVI